MGKSASETDSSLKAKFPKGAKVRLNVGGPAMAVYGYVDTAEGETQKIRVSVESVLDDRK